MTDFYVLEDTTYMIDVIPTDCTCSECEGLRSAGYSTYESFAYLETMLIGSDCCASSVDEAFDSGEVMCQMFHRGELGHKPHNWFTHQAIEHVKRRQ